MANVQTLLPPNGKPFLRAFEQAVAYEERLAPGIDLIPNVKGRELPDWLRFLLYEYGLIELTGYVPNPYDLLATGRVWQIERDTFAAVARGLGWVAAPGSVVEAPARRFWWNSFQLYLQALPPADAPHLERIDRVTQLSKPFRSDFRRGVFGYDAPAFETDTTRLDASLLDRESGVRIRAGGPLWSFGRPWELEHQLTRTEGEALGIWTDRIADAEFLLDFLNGEAILGDDPTPTIEEGSDFARASSKLAEALDGSWTEFAPNVMAVTDRGLLLEPESTRLTAFSLDENPTDDVLQAEVLAAGLPGPMGDTAVRVKFSDAGWLLYVPADGIEPDTTYPVSFFAKLVSSSGSGLAGPLFSQLAVGEWRRVEGEVTTPAVLDGQWLDLSMLAPGAEVIVELDGFQIETADRVTSPIRSAEISDTRAADELVLVLPGADAFYLTITFDNGAAQPLLDILGPYAIDPAALNRPYVAEIGSLRAGTWDSMAFPWDDATFPWNGDASSNRARILAAWFEANPDAHFRLKDAGGAVIGYRRVRVARQVAQQFGGRFEFAGADYGADEEGTTVLIEAMTDAGNGGGQSVATVELIIGGSREAGVPPGRLWVTPGQLTGGVVIARKTPTIPLRATVRERLKLMLRF